MNKPDSPPLPIPVPRASTASTPSFIGRWTRVGAFLSLALVLPVAASAQQAYARMAVNLRAGPGTDYPVVASLANGQPFSVAGCTSGYGWCDVVMPDGLRGWVYSAAIDYAYEDRRVPLAGYGAAIGIPIVTFALGSYWGNYYRDRPWYGDRRYWGGRPPPPREGWQRPPPARPEWRPNPWQGPRPGADFRPGPRPDYRPPNPIRREPQHFQRPHANEVRPQRDPGMRPGREGGMRPPPQQHQGGGRPQGPRPQGEHGHHGGPPR